ncbi:MAG: hypothetical protein ACK2UW_14580 [Anaerolineales bacterium]
MAAEEAAVNRVDVAAAYGGDGTVKAVAQGLLSSQGFQPAKRFTWTMACWRCCCWVLRV